MDWLNVLTLAVIAACLGLAVALLVDTMRKTR